MSLFREVFEASVLGFLAFALVLMVTGPANQGSEVTVPTVESPELLSGSALLFQHEPLDVPSLLVPHESQTHLEYSSALPVR